MTKNKALLILDIFHFLKMKPNDAFTLEKLIGAAKFGDKSAIVDSMGYLIGKRVVGSTNGDSFWFIRDLDEESIKN